MQIVIEIDDKTYKEAKDKNIITDRTVVNAIANGTPLPKGDLIELEQAKEAMFNLCDNSLGDYAENPHIDAIIEALDNLSIVIEGEYDEDSD